MVKTTSFLATTLFLLTVSVNAQFAGRYTDGKDYAVYFAQTSQGLTIRPVMWTATQLLRETDKDKFIVVDRATREAEFRRDARGNVIGVTIRGMDGEGLELRRERAPLLAVELLLAGRLREAAACYRRTGRLARALDDAEQVLIRLPTRTHSIVSFLDLLAPQFKTDARFHRVLGYGLVQAGDRLRAVTALRRSYRLDPADKRTIAGLVRLKSLKLRSANDEWRLPFPLAAVFAKPTKAEINAVEKDWSQRDLRPRGIREERRAAFAIADTKFNVRIVSHLVHEKRHYGAIITPEKMTGRKLPVIIEAKGVSPTYFPLDLTRLAAPRMMADRASEFIYVVPSFRGEVLNFEDGSYTSEGDRTDALDGATDDAIALLNVALQTTPEADGSRICAFGHSRGGTVAMLFGIRDKRVTCVVNWAGPIDWFYAMGTNGWTEMELWADALRNRANTQQPGGQNVERFLKHALDGQADLDAVRHRMIASSPLYFAHRLPRSQHHYGKEDPFVPERNGRQLIEAMRRAHMPATRYDAFFYPGEGHDTDRIAGPIKSREFIAEIMGVTK